MSLQEEQVARLGQDLELVLDGYSVNISLDAIILLAAKVARDNRIGAHGCIMVVEKLKQLMKAL